MTTNQLSHANRRLFARVFHAAVLVFDLNKNFGESQSTQLRSSKEL